MEEAPLKMKTWGKLRGKEIMLTEELGIPGEVEVEVEISFPKEEAEVFGIWKDRKDIKSSIDWVRNFKVKRMAEMVIFDSDILIDYFKAIEQAKEFIFIECYNESKGSDRTNGKGGMVFSENQRQSQTI